MAHRYTAEIIYHFECDLCHLWWSYAISPTKLTNYNLKNAYASKIKKITSEAFQNIKLLKAINSTSTDKYGVKFGLLNKEKDFKCIYLNKKLLYT